MSQPDWELVAQLGDTHPIEHGGLFVFVDKTGVYAPEAEHWQEPEDHVELEDGTWEVHRFILENCTYIDGILSDNKYHPQHPAWFAKDLPTLASGMGLTVDEFAAWFTSNNPVERAWAWLEVGQYWGYDNLDNYPDRYNHDEIKARVKMHNSCKTENYIG